MKDITMEDIIAYFKEKGASESEDPLYFISLTDGADTKLETMGGCDAEDAIMMLLFHMDSMHNIMQNIDKYSTDSDEEWMALIGMLYLNFREKYGKTMDDMRNNSQKLEITKVPGWMK